MFENTRLFARLLSVTVLMVASGLVTVRAQDTALQDIKYSEDYDRVQSILKVSDILKRDDRILTMYKERPDMDQKLQTYLDGIFTRDLEALMSQQNYAALKTLSERTLKLRPKFGDVYLFQGIVLKSDKKMSEAMTAFARCYGMKSERQAKAKQQLDLLYRAANGGSLIGQEKFIKEAMKDLK
jgi:hypothetical protein